MAGLVPAIHVFSYMCGAKTWMPGSRPGMTTLKDVPHLKSNSRKPPGIYGGFFRDEWN
jgi:hypothetical protein